MLKNIFRVALVVLVAGIIALGWYTFSLSPAAESLTPARGAAHLAEAGSGSVQTDASASTGETRPALARPEGGAESDFSLARGLGGFLKHALILAGVTVAVLLVRKTLALVGAWRESRKAASAGATAPASNRLDRRQFLHLAGLAAAGGALAVVYKSVAGLGRPVPPANANPASRPESVPQLDLTATSQRCVACPKGLVNDPYPGQCHDYFDADNDGFCDYSVAFACNSASGEQPAASAQNGASPARSGGHFGPGGRRRQRTETY